MEWAGAAGHGISIGEGQKWWSGKLGENFVHDNLHGWRELKLDPLPKEGGDRADPVRQITQEFAIVPHAAQQDTHLL